MLRRGGDGFSMMVMVCAILLLLFADDALDIFGARCRRVDLHQPVRRTTYHHPSGRRDDGLQPFVVLFSSSSGSTWLIDMLSRSPDVCVLGFEVLDTLEMTPKNRSDSLEYIFATGSTRKAADDWMGFVDDMWAFVKKRTQVDDGTVSKEYEKLMEMVHRCSVSRDDGRALFSHFGLKVRARNFDPKEPRRTRYRKRLLEIGNARAATKGHEQSGALQIARVFRDENVRVLLTQRSGMMRAVAEYRRRYEQKGQFNLRIAMESNASKEHMARLMSSSIIHPVEWSSYLNNVYTEEEVQDDIVRIMIEDGGLPMRQLHPVRYDDLLNRHNETMSDVHEFLGLPGAYQGPLPSAYKKSSPPSFCRAAANCIELCKVSRRNQAGQRRTEDVESVCKPIDDEGEASAPRGVPIYAPRDEFKPRYDVTQWYRDDPPISPDVIRGAPSKRMSPTTKQPWRDRFKPGWNPWEN